MIPIIIVLGIVMVIRAMIRENTNKPDVLVGFAAIITGTLLLAGGVSWHAFGWNFVAMPLMIAIVSMLVAAQLIKAILPRMLFFVLVGLYAPLCLHTGWWVPVLAFFAAAALFLLRYSKRPLQSALWLTATTVALTVTALVAVSSFSALEYVLFQNSAA